MTRKEQRTVGDGGRRCPVPRRNPAAGAGDDRRRPYGQCAMPVIARRGRACPVPVITVVAGVGDHNGPKGCAVAPYDTIRNVIQRVMEV